MGNMRMTLVAALVLIAANAWSQSSLDQLKALAPDGAGAAAPTAAPSAPVKSAALQKGAAQNKKYFLLAQGTGGCYWGWYADNRGKWRQTQFCSNDQPCVCTPSIAPIEISPICITDQEYRCADPEG